MRMEKVESGESMALSNRRKKIDTAMGVVLNEGRMNFEGDEV